MKQPGESQSKYEDKYISTFVDQKCLARHLLALFIAVTANCCHSVEDEKEIKHSLKTLKARWKPLSK